jgi:hypothetical protein
MSIRLMSENQALTLLPATAATTAAAATTTATIREVDRVLPHKSRLVKSRNITIYNL